MWVCRASSSRKGSICTSLVRHRRHRRGLGDAGGVPLTADGTVVGAVGVSGGQVDQDQQVAQSAAAAFEHAG